MQITVSEFVKHPEFFLERKKDDIVTIIKDDKPVAFITYHHPTLPKYDLKKMLEIYPHDTDEDEEIDWGQPVGDEKW